MLRYCHRNDWKYFDQLFASASPLEDSSSTIEEKSYEIRPVSSMNNGVLKLQYLSRHDKVTMLPLWRAWKRYIRHRIKLKQNILWMKQRRCRSWWSQWRKYIHSRSTKKLILRTKGAIVHERSLQIQSRIAWIAWYRACTYERWIRERIHTRELQNCLQIWSQWMKYIANNSRRWRNRHVAMYRYLVFKWQQWKRGIMYRRHQSLQLNYMMQWKARERLKRWHTMARSNSSLRTILLHHQSIIHQRALWHIWQRWRDFLDSRRIQQLKIGRARTWRLAKWWRLLQHNIVLQTLYYQRLNVARTHYDQTLQERVIQRWQFMLQTRADLFRLSEAYHTRLVVAKSFSGIRQLLDHRDAELGTMQRYHQRRCIQLWGTRVQVRKKLSKHERLLQHTVQQRQAHSTWVQWKLLWTRRLLEHHYDQFYLLKLLRKLIRYWKSFLNHQQLIARRCATSDLHRVKHWKQSIFSRWHEYLRRKEIHQLKVDQLRTKHAIRMKRYMFTAISQYTLDKQHKYRSLQLADAHQAHQLRKRRLPLALFAWKCAVEDVHALVQLWSTQIATIHRYWCRRMVLRLWGIVAQRQLLARHWGRRKLLGWIGNQLKSWHRHCIHQKSVNQAIHALAIERTRQLFVTAWNSWRNHKFQLAAARQEAHDRYVRRRLVGLLSCFVAWANRYRHRKLLWGIAIAFRQELCQRQSNRMWRSWLQVFNSKLERYRKIQLLIQLHDQRCKLAHFKSWYHHVNILREGRVLARMHRIRQKQSHFVAWAVYIDTRHRLLRATMRFHHSHERIKKKQGIARWISHLHKIHMSDRMKISQWRKHAVQPWYQQWRGHFMTRVMAKKGELQIYYATKRRIWMLWKIFVAEKRDSRLMAIQAHKHHSRKTLQQCWIQLFSYCCYRNVQHERYHQAIVHCIRYHLTKTVQKLRDHAYLSSLLLTVDQNVIRKHFQAWILSFRSRFTTSKKKAVAVQIVSDLKLQRGILRWKQWANQQHESGEKLRVFSAQRKKFAMQQVWEMWKLHSGVTTSQRVGMYQCQLRFGLKSWIRFTASSRQQKEYDYRLRALHSSSLVTRTWLSWQQYHNVHKKDKVIRYLQRRKWYFRMVRHVWAERQFRRQEFIKISTAFQGWLWVIWATVKRQDALWRLTTRLALAKVFKKWRNFICCSKRVMDFISKRNRRLLRPVLHMWYRVLTVSVLTRYHTTKRCRYLMHQILGQWHFIVISLRRQQLENYRLCRSVFSLWFEFTYVHQAMSNMRARHEIEMKYICFRQWKQKVTKRQFMRHCRQKQIRQRWKQWIEFVEGCQDKKRVFKQLWAVMEHEQAMDRSNAYDQTIKMIDELEHTRDNMHQVFKAWQFASHP